MKKMLWLVSWFPNRTEPLTGDFIERHARAVSLFHKITVLFVVKDAKGITSGKTFVEKRKYNNNLDAVILYYKPVSRVRAVEKLLSGLRYFWFYRRLIKTYIIEEGKPDGVHTHICYKAGLVALYSRVRYGLPYFVSEQWTVFCPNAVPAFRQLSFLADI